jgi:hypothetical protein
MRKVELFEAIRRDRAVHGWGVRKLSRVHRVGRGTVRQALRSSVPPPRQAPMREAPVLGAGKPFIEAVLEADREAPRKQRTPPTGFVNGHPNVRTRGQRKVRTFGHLSARRRSCV